MVTELQIAAAVSLCVTVRVNVCFFRNRQTPNVFMCKTPRSNYTVHAHGLYFIHHSTMSLCSLCLADKLRGESCLSF